jgi:alginate O-acetyltransferase complex protein AlgI
VSFTSQIFVFVFAPLAIGIYWLLPVRWRLAWLVLTSYAFYAYWDWRYSGLMLLTTLIDYSAGLGIARAKSRAAARGWLLVSLLANLGLLAFFKYTAFAITTGNGLAALFGIEAGLFVPKLVLPLGISFYTFQSIAYTIDVYRKRIKPTQSLLAYAAFVSLFPRLLAGPITRWQQLGAQLAALPARLDWRRLNLGLVFFCAGLVKKVLIADRLAYYINPLWLDWRHLAAGEAWAAALGYTLQIYFDFAGYSLMALGVGYLLGLDLPQNFNSPYRSTDIADFWRRWHMSLSFWLRDYLFFPLGGMHPWRRWFALVATMAIAGLWHGAAWTFVIWGTYHGVMLLVHHALREKKLRWRGGWAGRIGTLLLVLLGWVLFRADNVAMAGTLLARMFNVPQLLAHCMMPKGYLPLAFIALLWAMLGPNVYELLQVRKARPAPVALALLGLVAAIGILMLADTSPFLYNQF